MCATRMGDPMAIPEVAVWKFVRLITWMALIIPLGAWVGAFKAAPNYKKKETVSPVSLRIPIPTEGRRFAASGLTSSRPATEKQRHRKMPLLSWMPTPPFTTEIRPKKRNVSLSGLNLLPPKRHAASHRTGLQWIRNPARRSCRRLCSSDRGGIRRARHRAGKRCIRLLRPNR